LPGDHHFYITFETGAQGVRMSTRMREKYPEEMTIVVQHQFWDLETTEHSFSIGLSFDNVPESLLVPFSAVRGFFDPSVQFGLQFDAPEDGDQEPAETPAASVASIGALPAPEAEKPEAEADTDDAPEGGAEVVSLDAFRKK
ncbi:MAG: ClpXP protease specificity-enhancing factor SspB, partial [Pseudomonadota bacterium]